MDSLTRVFLSVEVCRVFSIDQGLGTGLRTYTWIDIQYIFNISICRYIYACMILVSIYQLDIASVRSLIIINIVYI
jgi:hypothetical protein